MDKESQGTIAIADDHELIRQTISYRLTLLGYKVIIEADNGKVLLDKLDASPKPDICMLDINMPAMNGFETAIQLKNKWPDIKILFFSLHNTASYIKRAKEIGVDGYLSKDVPFEELKRTLHSILNKKQISNPSIKH